MALMSYLVQCGWFCSAAKNNNKSRSAYTIFIKLGLEHLYIKIFGLERIQELHFFLFLTCTWSSIGINIIQFLEHIRNMYNYVVIEL